MYLFKWKGHPLSHCTLIIDNMFKRLKLETSMNNSMPSMRYGRVFSSWGEMMETSGSILTKFVKAWKICLYSPNFNLVPVK